ncbi:hypothetical protein [Chelativorans sp. J32]|uniref:hypothetical protein n=1 Tax=Chelativorans sp. J32 TaxID=935840 RepID=UPI0012EB1F20|nr:hypothetical protein [Chelativorans sp. J32]
MNFLRDRELAWRFRENSVGSRERFHYFLAISFLTWLASSNILSSSVWIVLDWWLIATDIALLAICIVGSILCYRTNRNGDDREFIARAVCIGFPICIQAALLGIAISLVWNSGMGLASIHFERLREIPDSFSAFLFEVILGVYFYWRLDTALRIAAGGA